MNSFFTRIAGVFMLLVFLFPFVEKGMHDFEHRDDFHCTEKSSKHLHANDHDCSICDYQAPVSQHDPTDVNRILTFAGSCKQIILPVAKSSARNFLRSAPRGPPSFS
ncbi:MAG TPA: hypothetical protein VI731_11835 [Bacteroidia bacterium]|nr:hypothetical protein [Bacteroidia bacterium]